MGLAVKGDQGQSRSILVGLPTLRIRLFSELRLCQGETPSPSLESARAESLLAYLLLHRQAPQSRQRLAFILWPDSSETQARTNLRHVLHNLRRALPDPDRYLDVTPRTLQWRVGALFWLDVAAFEDALARAGRDAADGGLAGLREAVAIYTGDLLAGCYDEWILGERERLRQRYLDALERLTALLESRGDHAEAILYAEHLLRHDPLHEETYRLLMRLHDTRGDRARALRVFHVCAATLERELGVEPSAPTLMAYEALLPLARDPIATKGQSARFGGPPLVGRTSEWTRLTALWQASASGRAHLVLVSGEPGIGKTRLVEEFRSWSGHRGAVTAEARAYPAEGALAYGPVVVWLRSEPVKSRLKRLDQVHLTELARLLPELLSAAPGLARPEPLLESDLRQRLFDALARAILASGEPLLLVVDDLHWCDQETLRFLHYLLRVEPDACLLVAATARREEIDAQHALHDLRAGLQALDCFTEIELGRLTRDETGVLAERLDGRSLDERGAAQLYGETEGNPLFVVEALRAGWKSGQHEREWVSPKVQSVIESRLARLSEPARELIGVAATIGREFTSDVLADASEVDGEALVAGLDELWRRRIIREHGIDAYDFSHDRIREVAYLTLSPALRRQRHLRVAQALERLHAHDPGPVSGQLAAHYERAGAMDQAVRWYEQAADVAQLLHANVEAVRLLDRALDLLRTLPKTPERGARELAILVTLPTPLGAVEGYGAGRLTEAQQRALELGRAFGTEPASPLLRSLAIAGLCQDDFAGARRVGEQLHARGERDADEVLLVEGAYVLGIAAFWQGEFETARGHFAAAVDRYRAEHRGTHLLRYGQDPKVVCLSRLGNTLWFLGRPEAAAQACDAALALADEIGHPFSRGVALVFAAMLSLDMRDSACLRAYVAALATGREENESRQNRVAADAQSGYVEVLDGRAEVGIARIQRALDDAHRSDLAPGMRACLVRLLLAAQVAAGDTHAGLATADRALALEGGARVWEAETRRLRAEFLAVVGAPAHEIEAEIARALQVARRQGAISIELRAATSLLRQRLKAGAGRGISEARDLLATIVDRLPDNSDTPDLRDAVAFLHQI